MPRESRSSRVYGRAVKRVTAKQGDTFLDLSSRYGIDPIDLARANSGLLRPRAGAVINVPDRRREREETSPALKRKRKREREVSLAGARGDVSVTRPSYPPGYAVPLDPLGNIIQYPEGPTYKPEIFGTPGAAVTTGREVSTQEWPSEARFVGLRPSLYQQRGNIQVTARTTPVGNIRAAMARDITAQFKSGKIPAKILPSVAALLGLTADALRGMGYFQDRAGSWILGESLGPGEGELGAGGGGGGGGGIGRVRRRGGGGGGVEGEPYQPPYRVETGITREVTGRYAASRTGRTYLPEGLGLTTWRI